MKNKILKFIELLREAHENDEQDLNDITLDLKDELIEFEIHKGYFSKQALDRGQIGDRAMGIINYNPVYDDDKYCFCIDIPLEQLKDSLILGNRFGNRNLIKDKKIFTIFRELYQISERYDECFLHINAGNVTYRPAIYLFILLETEVDTRITKLMQIFKEIESRNSSAKSDFSNDTTVRLQDDKIVISSSYGIYTDRKFRNLIRDIDLSDFKIEKTIDETEVKNIISKK
jgi:hypothetical protein